MVESDDRWKDLSVDKIVDDSRKEYQDKEKVRMKLDHQNTILEKDLNELEELVNQKIQQALENSQEVIDTSE